MIQRYDVNQVLNQNEDWQWCKVRDVEKLEQENDNLEENNKVMKQEIEKLKQLNAEMLEVLKDVDKYKNKFYVDVKSIIERCENGIYNKK